MSECLRIAVVAEGPTDFIVIEAALRSILGDRQAHFRLLQPEECAAFEGMSSFGPAGGGWRGVYNWCQKAIERTSGNLEDDYVFSECDLLIMHLDADVAAQTNPGLKGRYKDDLPCAKPCPPAYNTTNALRGRLLGWCSLDTVPPGMVLCTPSKSTEAWVVAALFPTDREACKPSWECFRDPASRLAQQKKGKGTRIRKSMEAYRSRATEISTEWPRLESQLTEAARFSADVRKQLP